VPCCWRCNNAKHTRTADEFLDMCGRVAIRHLFPPI
jgi:hypothetical protein